MRFNRAAMKKFKVKHVIGICFVVICLYLLTVGSRGDTRVQNRERMKLTFKNTHFKHKEVKKILMWTDYFKDKNNMEAHRNCLKKCPAKCTVTDDKSEIDSADAVEFHLSNIWTVNWRIGTKSVIQFPKYRTPEQVWIVNNMEPPPHLFGNIEVLNGLFNWTKWYRYDADIITYYGKVHKLNTTESLKASQKLQGRNFYKEKTKEATLRIGNCFDPGQRYRLIKELGKYVSIDKYGSCYNTPCGDSTDPADKSCEKLMLQYKFYLAFENDNCKDYVTEKYWGTLTRDQIPIVNWKYVSASHALPHSYINIYDFSSIKDAADYINSVSVDEKLYNSYFEYRKHFTNRVDTCAMCQTCISLHDEGKPGQVYADLDGWVRDDVCKKVELWNNFMKNVYGWIFYLFGV